MSAFSKCNVCTDPEASDNCIFVCCVCGIGVHKLCYGIDDDCMDPWWCSPCAIDKYEPFCELCQQKGGALKKTTCGKWIHVICALFTIGVEFQNTNLMEPVNISKIPVTNRNKKCVFCSETYGICCKCTQPNCDKWLHVTCGQKGNCLKEVTAKKNKIAFRAFCIEHKPVDEASRRLSSAFVQGILSEEGQQHQIHQSGDDFPPIDANQLNDFLDTINASDSDEAIGAFDISNEASFSSRASEDVNNANTVSDRTEVTSEISVVSEASKDASDFISEDAKESSAVIDASEQKVVDNSVINTSKTDGSTSSQRNF